MNLIIYYYIIQEYENTRTVTSNVRGNRTIMYVLIVSLIVLGFVSERSQVRGDFINPLNYIRYERAVIQLGKRSTTKCCVWAGK